VDASAGSGIAPAVAAALAALDAAAIPWLHLRGALDGSAGDIDLLVDPAALGRVDAALAPAGFRRMPSIGYASHRFWLAFERETGRWLKLDVVTELAYGPGGALGAAPAAGPLRRRTPDGPVMRATPDDRFWSLLLHVCLDRPGPTAAHAAELAGLAAAALPDGQLGSVVASWAGSAASTRALQLAAAPAPDAAAYRRLGRRLLRGAVRAHPLRVVRRRTIAAVGRAASRLFVATRRPGIAVALLGPDGAGKSTLAAALSEAFPVPGRQRYLGLYGAGSETPRGLGLAVRAWRMVRARLATTWDVRRGRVVVLDRHPLDAVAARKGGRRAAVRRRLLVALAPRPTVVLVLDAPADVLFARKGEHDLETLSAARLAYRNLAERRRDAVVIDAMEPPEAVRAAAIDAVWPRLADAWRSRGAARG